MTSGLNSVAGLELFQSLWPLSTRLLRIVDERRFGEVQTLADEAQECIANTRAAASEEVFLNDLYIIRAWFRMLSAYGRLWEKICDQQFSDSWNSLQDALSVIRIIKRLSMVDVSFFEDQLRSLESAYPYRIFASIGAVASRIECSICGEDIDSFACGHRRGYLYAGEMAIGIIRDVKTLDHVSFVCNPVDKRCVVQMDDTSEAFKLIRYISGLIRGGEFSISEFEGIDFSERRILNPAYQKLGRNELCYCSSGKKFKDCCIDNEFVTGAHAQVQARRQRQ